MAESNGFSGAPAERRKPAVFRRWARKGAVREPVHLCYWKTNPESKTMEADKSMQVLCVEDNPNLRKVLVNIIRKIGYTSVIEAEDGVQAWEKIEEGGIGLVLTDWSMPRMNGLELLMKIRRGKPKIAKTPILMITAADTKKAIMDAATEGVDGYIIKPFSVSTIAEKIEEALAKRSRS